MMEIRNTEKVTNTVTSKVMVSVVVLKATTRIKMEAPWEYFHTDRLYKIQLLFKKLDSI
jgi:hypothetical protein